MNATPSTEQRIPWPRCPHCHEPKIDCVCQPEGADVHDALRALQ